ncbi:LysR family transcriptional regulator [Pseudomonas yamanorum]|uniref:LysR family transcriptional regulator n=1 Tax=Pseudomonas yamanorum TaxID=515393 RepID=UPI0015A0A3A8|nr:LysR family transcriptional regulator [Pseudomonas yamanorum]NWD23600.1 LysR family transcriptional regulator [Pseudomonas yamanorum]
METLSWDDLRILLAVHRAGSLLGAGKVLGLSTSTTARRLDALEACVGHRLVHRSQSGTELNPQALAMVQLALALEHGLDALRRDQAQMAGTLRISVPDGIAPMLARSLIVFQQDHPGIDIELLGDNRMVDVAAREADIAIRIARSSSSVLVEKRLASFRFGLFASQDYVRRHLPATELRTGEATTHPFVGLDERWIALPHEQWMRELGATRFPFRSSSMQALTEAVSLGAGIGAFLELDPRTTGLVRIGTTIPGPVQPFYLVFHRDLRTQPHVRAAIAAIERYVHTISVHRD